MRISDWSSDVCSSDLPIAAQHSCLGPTAADQCHDLIAVDELSLLIHDDQPVGIAVKRNPNIRPGRHYRFLAGGGCRRTATIIDVQAIGADTDSHNFRTQLPEHRRGDLKSSATSEIDNHIQV